MTLEDRLRELAARAARGGCGFTRFLDPAQKRAAGICAAKAGVSAAFFGGYEGAERELACFYAEDKPDEFPIACVEARWNAKFASAEHRDVLGAVMGLQLEREVTGDILIKDSAAYIFVARDMAGYLCENLVSAGRASLTCSVFTGDIEPPEPKGRLIRATVQSLRLDSLVSAAYDLSRAKAQDLIRAGLVKLNHVPETRCDVKVGEGDTLSARGLGRAQIRGLTGETRRGRLAAMVFLFGK